MDQEPARRLPFLHTNEPQNGEGGGWEPLPLQDTEHRIDCWWQKVPIPFSSIRIKELICHQHPLHPLHNPSLHNPEKSAHSVFSESQRHFHCYGYRNLHKISQHICCSIYHASMVDWYLTKVFPRISTFQGKVERHAIKVFLGIVIPPICFPIASKTESSFKLRHFWRNLQRSGAVPLFRLLCFPTQLQIYRTALCNCLSSFQYKN